MKNKYFLSLISIFTLSLAYFTIRIQNLTSLPVFADEAIYIRWSQIIKNVETLRFIPLTDGKQPLFMWLSVPFLKFFSDPLFAVRLLSVFSGLLLLLGLIALFSLLLSQLKSKPLHSNPLIYFLDAITHSFPYFLIPALIYITLPFSFFFDRLALADTLLSAFACSVLIFALIQTSYKRLDISLLSGLVLGLAWLTKSPAIYFISLYIFTVFLLQIINRRISILSFVNILISITLAFIIYNLLRLGPQFSQIAVRNLDYVWPFTEIIKHPFDPLKPHLIDTIHLYRFFIGLPLFVITAFGALLAFISRKLPKNISSIALIFILLIWWLAPLIANSAFAKVFTARYILFTLPPLLVLISLSITFLLAKSRFFIIIFIVPLILNSALILRISQSPASISYPSTELGYTSDWTSGWGIKESAAYLKSRSLEANVIVGSEGYFGTLPDGLQIYTDGTPRLTIIGSGLNITEIPANLKEAKAAGDEVYLLFNQSRLKLSPDTLNELSVVKKFPKPNNDALLLIKI